MRIFPILIASSLLLASEEMTVDLRNPSYCNGILYTSEGGVIQNKDIRIQARTIQYIQKEGVHRIEAEGDLLIQYKGRAYIGSELEYDFLKRCGTVYNGKTAASMWYLSGDQIDLKPNGDYHVKNVAITTCENKESTWDLHASHVEVMKQEFFSAQKVRFRLFRTPMLWLPSFKLNLKRFREPVFRYSVAWDKGLGPRAAVRYQLYSWRDLALYGRVEYRWATGWGGALETDYAPPDKKTTFVTRSYLGKDRLQTATNKEQRYRLQGALHSTSENGKTITTLTWDKYNDVRMPTVFRSDDFEVNTAQKTLLYVRHQEEGAIAAFKLRPRVNPFESIKQDLPSFSATFLPRQLGKSGIYNFAFLRASYIDFAYSDQLVQHLQDFRSVRLELKDQLERPLFFGPLVLTPFVGGHLIFYSDSPSDRCKGLLFGSYGAEIFARGEKTYSRYKHVIEPYAALFSLTRPTVAPDDHYIFSIADGYEKIDQLQMGVRNLLFSKKRSGKEASFTADLFLNGFISDPTIPQFFPHLYLNLAWRLPSLHLTWENGWNFRQSLLDFSKARLLWTIGENGAIAIEGRYRSSFDWRKADSENFILDVTRSQSELLLSPLSDRRVTFLASAFFRLNPLWDCQVSSINGFYRTDENPYWEVKVDLSTWISSSFKMRLSYSRVQKVDRVSVHLDLVKK